MSVEAKALFGQFAGDLRVLHERRTIQASGLQRLFLYAVGEDYQSLGLSASVGPTQQETVETFRGTIPGDYDSVPAMIKNHSHSVIELLRSTQKINASKISAFDVLFLAAATLPEEGYDGKKIPKLPNESESHQIFRLAMGRLQNTVERSKGKSVDDLKREFDLTARKLKIDPDVRTNADFIELARHLFIRRFLLGLQVASQEKYLTGETIRIELETAAEHMKRREILESEWLEVFRQEVTGKTRTITRRQVGTPREILDLEDNPRVQHLKDLVYEWGGNNTDPELEPRVKALRFRRQERGGGTSHKLTDPYFVAILPQRLTDGRVIEHAVFDSPIEGKNALFVYRGEYELQTGFNWVEVFDKSTKTDVQRFGGKKIVHRGDNWKEKVMDHLTIEADKLERIQI